MELIKVKLPEKNIKQLLTQNPYAGPQELKLVAEGIPKRDLIGFFNRKIKPYGSAFAVNMTSVLRSERGSLPSFRPLLNTFWVSDDKMGGTATPNADETDSTVAHEMVHILGDLGHLENNPIPNLMGGNKKSYALNEQQCRSILSFFFT